MSNLIDELEELTGEAERMASLSLVLVSAMDDGVSGCKEFVGAADVLSDHLFDHAKKLRELEEQHIKKG